MASGGDQDSEDTVLSPDELDIEAREEVASIGDDRYVIGADGKPNVPEQPPADAGDESESSEEPTDESAGDATHSTRDDDGSASRDAEPEITGRDVKRWLGDELSEQDVPYAYRIAAKSGRRVNHQQLATDDIAAAFDGLLVWYAQQVSEGTPVDEALGILLSESSVQIRYPTERLIAYLETHDLGPDDTIRDLVDTVTEEDGLLFPRRK
ncbi:DUF7500 family protein [Halobacterium bonnevillei]|uniref:Flagella cluster protein n=1 Tax=Halobacterium bonnevillei TaxID=2692200 RepID=A0A6B0SGX1_9EURY|nr:hypothetical protein [Halobacterium bonnevillei]MXR21034.1 hypothetical protein [Halobacterium bonnevillei]